MTFPNATRTGRRLAFDYNTRDKRRKRTDKKATKRKEDVIKTNNSVTRRRVTRRSRIGSVHGAESCAYVQLIQAALHIDQSIERKKKLYIRNSWMGHMKDVCEFSARCTCHTAKHCCFQAISAAVRVYIFV